MQLQDFNYKIYYKWNFNGNVEQHYVWTSEKYLATRINELLESNFVITGIETE